MRVTATELPEVLVIDLDVFADDRGEFTVVYHDERFADVGLPTRFRQDNESRSRKGVLRGLHYQLRHPQGKLIACTRGAVFDVAVDIRVGSPTFGKWIGATLSEERHQVVWVPPGFAHGFCALTEGAVVRYKCTELRDASDERGILWNDADLCIDWPVTEALLSARDRGLPRLRDADLPRYAARVASSAAR